MISYKIGRDDQNDVILEPPSVSSHHAVLKHYDGNVIVLEDLDSGNGTWVNGRRIKSALISFEDEIKLGNYEFDLASYFRVIDGVIWGPKLPNDYSDHFPQLVKIEEEHEKVIDNINKKSSNNMLFFRVCISILPLIGLSRYLINKEQLVQWGPLLIILFVIVSALAIYFYARANKSNRKKRKLIKMANDDFKLEYTCPNQKCKQPINDSTYVMKNQMQYVCRYCKSILYQTSLTMK